MSFQRESVLVQGKMQSQMLKCYMLRTKRTIFNTERHSFFVWTSLSNLKEQINDWIQLWFGRSFRFNSLKCEISNTRVFFGDMFGEDRFCFVTFLKNQGCKSEKLPYVVPHSSAVKCVKYVQIEITACTHKALWTFRHLSWGTYDTSKSLHVAGNSESDFKLPVEN